MPIFEMVTPTGADNERPLDEYEQRQYGHERDDTRWVIRTTFVGKVIAIYEKNGYNDSDFYAIAETDEPGEFTTVCYATTRGWTYLNRAVVDATPDVVERYEAMRQRNAEEAAARRAEFNKRRIVKDVPVRVTRGKHKGVEGTVGWVGEDAYNRRRDYNGWGIKHIDDYRVGIRVEGQKKFTFVGAQYVEIQLDGEWIEPNPPGTTVNDVAYALTAETWRNPQTAK